MKIVGKILIYLAALIFLGGFATLFWEEASGEIVEYHTLSKTYVGNSGVAVLGATNRSGATKLVSVKYRYTVNGINYTAFSIQFSGGGSSHHPSFFRPTAAKVYYSSTFPYFSVIDRGIQIIWVILLALLGFGLTEIHNWFVKHSTPKQA